MLKIDTNAMGIQQDNVLLFSDFESGGVMWAEVGPRKRLKKIKFSEPFLNPPIVQVHLSMFDADSSKNHRFDVGTEAVTREGFTIVFQTWGDSRIARVRASWMAIGAVQHEDLWDV